MKSDGIMTMNYESRLCDCEYQNQILCSDWSIRGHVTEGGTLIGYSMPWANIMTSPGSRIMSSLM